MLSTLSFGEHNSRRGAIAALVAVCLIVIVGIVAIALEGGLLQDNKRRVQAAADAAALAAAADLYVHYPANKGKDPSGTALQSALANASANGYSNDTTTSVVTVNIPPTSGYFTDQTTYPGYVEVIVQYNQKRGFSTIFGTGTLPVRGRAVARARWGGSGNGVIVLDPSSKDALDASGNGSLTVTGSAAVIVDSNHASSAARATGGGTLTAANFNIAGGANGTFNGTVTTGVTPVPDPLAYLPVPSVPPDGVKTETSLGKGNKQYTLTPGRYTSLPNFNTGDVVVLKQASAGNGGVYYIDGGGLTSTGATIVMDTNTDGGVMIYNNPANASSSQGVNITGNSAGIVNLSALTSGPYAGMLFWQNRTGDQTMSVTGNGSFNLQGTFYMANAKLSVTGNGTATIGSQYISRTLNISGNGATTINYTENGTARVRQINLVE